MNALELKHTTREKVQMPTALAAVSIGFQFVQPRSAFSAWQIGLLTFGVWVFVWALISQQFVRVDDEGFTYRRFLFTKRVKWQQITKVEADWSEHFEGLASSYGANAFMGYFKFRGAGGKVLLKAKVNCGPVETRRAIYKFMAHKLGSRMLPIATA